MVPVGAGVVEVVVVGVVDVVVVDVVVVEVGVVDVVVVEVGVVDVVVVEVGVVDVVVVEVGVVDVVGAVIPFLTLTFVVVLPLLLFESVTVAVSDWVPSTTTFVSYGIETGPLLEVVCVPTAL